MKPSQLMIVFFVGAAFLIFSCESDKGPSFANSARSLAALYLQAMDEPLIEEMPSASYRFLFMPPFHDAFAIRASCGTESCVLVSKQLSRKSGPKPGLLSYEFSRTLSRDEWRTVVDMVEKAGFWNDPEEPYALGLGDEDSVLWILEGKLESRQYAWATWLGLEMEHDRLRRISLKLLEISELAEKRPELVKELSAW